MLFWERLREEEFDKAIKASEGVCVVPIGCLEKHGQHQPTGCDLYIARTVLEEAAKAEEVVIFPTPHWVGDVSPYHSRLNPDGAHGGIGLNPLTLFRLLEELCDEIYRNGFNKILLFSAHGGNAWLLPQFLRHQAEKKKPYATYFYTVDDNVEAADPERLLNNILTKRDEFPMITDEDIEILKGWLFAGWGFGGGHANFVEDAQLMVRHKELIAPERYDAESGLSTHKADYLYEMGIRSVRSTNYPNNYSGYAPHGSNERIGQAIIKLDAERAAKALRAVKEDVSCLKAVEH
ncbi:MAG: creatininase family protein [Ruminococcaceae bacterium]|nr:creatininase family protein [Oscillospiraceae bacterium]